MNFKKVVSYIDMLSVFDNDYPSDLNTKKVYSKRKIIELTKNIKNGLGGGSGSGG